MKHYSLPTAIAATAALWCSATASTSGGIGGIRSSPPLAFQNLLPPNINLPSISSFFLPPNNRGGGGAATGGRRCGDVDLEDRLLAAIESGRSGGGAPTVTATAGPSPPRLSALDTARALVTQGGPGALWKGVGYPVITIAVQVKREK